ncbi:MAG: COX15/CtaA family protein [Planctomycetes bacterium]|nr:COX15/CtaA family protein [Planctomycetota bacterium]
MEALAEKPLPAAPPGAARRDAPAVLTLGFGAAVAMWALGYVGRLPGLLELPPSVLALGFVAVLLAAGALAGRALGRVLPGALAGAVAGAINVLIIASVARGSPLAIPGSIAAGALLGAVGAAAARRPGAAPLPATTWTGRFARVAVAATLLLLAVGGLVTSHAAGLDVPDWPNTFGSNMFLFPLERMTGGIYYEHAHRLFGALVGLTTVTFAGLVLATDDRRWTKGLALLAVVLVVTQGVLGGLRVTGRPTLSLAAEDLSPQLWLAVAHGILGQLFFALLVVLAAATSVTWRQAPPPAPRASGETDLDLGAWFVAAVVVQLVLGALLRHYKIDPTWHVCMAVVVVTLGGFAGVRAWGLYPDLPVLRRAGLALAHLVALQLLLGIGALVVTTMERPEGTRVAWHAPIATAHQTTGAVILGCAVLLRIWFGRLVAREPAA